MNREDFVDAIKVAVRNAAIDGTLSGLTRLPGRNPHPALVELSKWFTDLDESGRRMIEALVERSVDQAVFGFLAVLDGVRAVESLPDKGTLELYYVRDREKFLINNPKEESLHEIYSSTPR